MNSKYIAEFIGTVVFLTIILKSRGDKYIVAAGLLAAILLMGNVSGGHFNPAVSFMNFLTGNLSNPELIGYIVAQLAGAWAALRLARI